MIADKATAAERVRHLAGIRWDAALADRGGFGRRATSLLYVRKVADGGRQRIHLDVLLRPGGEPLRFHLAPRVTIAISAMADVGARLLGSRTPGFGKSGTVDIVPLELIADDSPMLLFSTAEQLDDLAPRSSATCSRLSCRIWTSAEALPT
jgi:hypothetical protein